MCPLFIILTGHDFPQKDAAILLSSHKKSNVPSCLQMSPLKRYGTGYNEECSLSQFYSHSYILTWNSLQLFLAKSLTISAFSSPGAIAEPLLLLVLVDEEIFPSIHDRCGFSKSIAFSLFSCLGDTRTIGNFCLVQHAETRKALMSNGMVIVTISSCCNKGHEYHSIFYDY